MKPWQKRLIRAILAIASIMVGFDTIPADAIEWVQKAGSWITLIILAMWSNSDFAKKE